MNLKKSLVVLSRDPMYVNRPCYKNRYGEIIVWTSGGNYSHKRLEIYVQINGWKTLIDVNFEYKRIFKKLGLFVSLHKKLEMIFMYHVYNKLDFFGLKIDNNDQSINLLEESPASFIGLENPFTVNRLQSLKMVLVISSIFLPIIQLILLITCSYLGGYNEIFVLKNIINILTICLCFLMVVAIKNIHIITKVITLLSAIIYFELLYLFRYRLDILIVDIVFLLCLLYFIFWFIIAFVKKKSNSLVNGIVPLIYPTCYLIYKTIELQEHIYFSDKMSNYYLLMGIGFSIICTLLFIIFGRKTSKKDFFCIAITVLMGSFLFAFGVPYLTSQNINYCLDKSIGEENKFYIYNKYVDRSGKNDSYYLSIKIDNEYKNIEVPIYIYNEYNYGDYIIMYYHTGFAKIDYYEYRQKK